jgi:hypothetical protein
VSTEDESRLIEKLRKIELLFARSPFPGEQAAAETAADRIRERIRQLEKAERAIEFRFSLPDTWSKALFIALLRRYNLSQVLAGDTVIGWSELECGDPPMGVAFGVLHPNTEYALFNRATFVRVRPAGGLKVSHEAFVKTYWPLSSKNSLLICTG